MRGEGGEDGRVSEGTLDWAACAAWAGVWCLPVGQGPLLSQNHREGQGDGALP